MYSYSGTQTMKYNAEIDYAKIVLHTPKYQLYKLKIRLRTWPIYKRALRLNVVPVIKEFIQSRCIDYKQNVIISIFGETGTGKSYIAFVLCEYISTLNGVPFSHKNIYIDLAELKEALKDAMPGESYVLDEQTDVFGEGSGYTIAAVKNIEMTCRKRQINFFFCSPMVRTHYHNYILESFMIRWPKQNKTVQDKGYIPFGYTYAFAYQAGSTSYLDPIGFIKTGHPKGLPYLVKYEKYKDKKIDNYLEGGTIDLETIKEKYVLKFLNDPIADSCLTKDEIKEGLLKVLPKGLPTKMTDSLVTRVKMVRKGIDI